MPRSRLPIALTLAVVVAGLAAFLVYRQFLAGDSVARLTLPPATVAAGSTASPSGVGSSAPSASSVGGASSAPVVATPAGLAGTWTIGDGSVVGYRVREQLGGVSALSDAVGRTIAITGTATLAATADSVRVTAASFQADLTQLTSDDARRDNRIRSIGLESARYPTSTFTLTTPLDVPASGLGGAAVDVALAGDLTIHGVTKSVTIAGQARLNGDRIQIAASLTFPFSDFGMTPPSIGGFVSVQDTATLEVLLSLAKG
ncbi:MAG: YceI family protein [Chloroflexi bacterium]|nr:YceI family protein [Chloroflexota bacterium]